MKKLGKLFTLTKIMKITCVQLILAVVFAGLTMARNGMAQDLLNRPVSVQFDNKDLKTVLRRLEKAANVKFTYVPQLIEAEHKVSIRATNDRLEVVLDRLLKPLNISYQISGNYIVLRKETSRAETAPSPSESLRADDVVVTGTITDEKGVTLPGVSVLLKGTNVVRLPTVKVRFGWPFRRIQRYWYSALLGT